MRFLLVYCLFSFTSIGLFAIDYSFTLKKQIPVKKGYFTTDPIGNLYVVRDNNFIVKYNNQGDSLAVFNDVNSGAVTLIDATNPLRVLVFYSGFSQIKILDNMLSLKNEIDLSKIGLFNVPAIANSMDGNIWVFDPSGNLLKINEQIEVQYSYPLRNMIDFAVSPSHMVERDRTLYMTDTTEGILQFDRFGFYRTIYRFHTNESNVLNNYIVYYKNGKLNSYNTKSLQSSEIDLPHPENILNARIEKNQVYVLRSDQIDIYTFKESK